MPAHSYMLDDIFASLLAVCLFAVFLVLPGYAIAWLSNLFAFRRRSSAFQFTLSLPLSIAVCPIVTYIAWRTGSLNCVWGGYGASALLAAFAMTRERVSLPRWPAAVAIMAAVWTAIAIFTLIDLQIGGRAWFPSAAFDYSVRAQFIHSIGSTGIPPANPFFLPEHPVTLRYHYFWLMMCALVDLAGGAAVSARQAWIGSVVWCGFALMATVALYLRLFAYKGPAHFRRRAIAGALLLGVGGLDLLPTAGLWALQAAGMRGVFASMEWWNEQVDGFVYSALWESHYLAGLIACLIAFLVLWEASRQRGARRIAYIAIAALAQSSTIGSSIYIAFVFALFFAAWTLFTLWKRWWTETSTLLTAGVAGLLLSLPYVLSLRGPGAGGPLLKLWVRPFFPVDALMRAQPAAHTWIAPLANLLALPLNYWFELGFFLSAALLWRKKRRGTPVSRAEMATWLMIATSVLTCTFLRSSVIGNNDLGWRGFLIAQFGLLLLAVDVVADWGTPAGREQRGFLAALLALGAAASVYEIAINRFYPLLADHGTVAPLGWIAPDRHAGERNLATRQAGEWIDRTTSPGAVVQFNPHDPAQKTSAFLYSTRRTIASDENCLATFGGDPSLCPALIATLDRVYPQGDTPAPASIDEVCRALPIDVIGAMDFDSAWKQPGSWVWTSQPAFANRYVRLFRCGRSPRISQARHLR